MSTICMKEFYKHVSSWIQSYYNADALEWLRRFIENSNQNASVKQRLLNELELQKAKLTGKFHFKHYDNATYLMDAHGYPEVFTTRYAVMQKLYDISKHGYIAEPVTTGSFYRIRLTGFEAFKSEDIINEQEVTYG